MLVQFAHIAMIIGGPDPEELGQGGHAPRFQNNYIILAGPVQIAQLCHLYSVENLLEHNT